jgi:hypothetical protein
VIREYKAQGWNIGNIEIAKDAQRAGRCLNRLVTGLWVLDISNGVADTIQAYREHKDWVGVAEKSFAEVYILPKGVTYIVEDVALGAIDLTPVGWVGTLAVAGVDAVGILIANHYLNKIGD